MASITVRNLDDDTVAVLKRRALDNNRSLEAEVREILRLAAGKPSRREIIAALEEVAAMTPAVPQTDSGELQALGRRR